MELAGDTENTIGDDDDGSRQIREKGKGAMDECQKGLQKAKGAKLQRETKTDPR